MSDKRELHKERLSTTDEHGHRVYLFPEDVRGIWNERRNIVGWFLIFVFLILPWIYHNGRQVILLDIAKREFSFFGTTFYAHDAPLLFFILLSFILLMGFLTSRFGRIWCGWACPQTVFIDRIFIMIERLVEGKARQRKKLEESPWNLEKILKRTIKWLLFLLVSLHISHSFLGYFVGTHELFRMSLHAPSENFTLFTAMLIITMIVLIDFGWFREQFCIIACPYGRFQSVMMDEESLIVGYDYNRGEPRRGAETPKDQEGDCINCFHCVKACPTGIDIRRGTQLECIACTRCVDACDEIMDKVGKPLGLIRYTSQSELDGKKRKKFGIRSLIYLILIAVTLSVGLFAVKKSNQLHITLIRAQSVFSTDTEGHIVNSYKVRIDSKQESEAKLYFKLKEGSDGIQVVTPISPLKVKSKGIKTSVIHFKFNPEILTKGSKVIFLNISNEDKLIETIKVVLVGPVS